MIQDQKILAMADRIEDNFTLCDFAGVSEAEVIVQQMLHSCRFHLKALGRAVTFKGRGLGRVTGGGLRDNPAGLRIVIDRGWARETSWDIETEEDCYRVDGCPVVLIPTEKLLADLEAFLPETKGDSVPPPPPVTQ